MEQNIARRARTIPSVYARQEFMTPGVEETLALLEQHCGVGPSTRILEVAFGKGEAACRLAMRHGCRVIGVDVHSAIEAIRQKTVDRRLDDRVSLVRGDGGWLPVREASIDGCLCTGGPSIGGGIERSMAEMHRVLKPDGWAVVSDWVWRKRPVPAAALPRWVTDDEPFTLLDEYAAAVRRAGFELILAQCLPSYVWEGYYGPMLQEMASWRTSGDPELEARFERSWDNEPRTFYEGLGREYWGYGVFIGRKVT
ncbi:MAG: methyltransferase domain-containing protein [Dehalococcoidia bacterium]|nr:methyltransferase domain-containing protein [Dehalococcoidia bacterium]